MSPENEGDPFRFGMAPFFKGYISFRGAYLELVEDIVDRIAFAMKERASFQDMLGA